MHHSQCSCFGAFKVQLHWLACSPWLTLFMFLLLTVGASVHLGYSLCHICAQTPLLRQAMLWRNRNCGYYYCLYLTAGKNKPMSRPLLAQFVSVYFSDNRTCRTLVLETWNPLLRLRRHWCYPSSHSSATIEKKNFASSSSDHSFFSHRFYTLVPQVRHSFSWKHTSKQ